MQDVLTREYHGHVVVSRQCAEPKKESDGWDHMLISVDFSKTQAYPTLAKAIAAAKFLTESLRAEEDAKRKKTQEQKDIADSKKDASDQPVNDTEK